MKVIKKARKEEKEEEVSYSPQYSPCSPNYSPCSPQYCPSSPRFGDDAKPMKLANLDMEKEILSAQKDAAKSKLSDLLASKDFIGEAPTTLEVMELELIKAQIDTLVPMILTWEIKLSFLKLKHSLYKIHGLDDPETEVYIAREAKFVAAYKPSQAEIQELLKEFNS